MGYIVELEAFHGPLDLLLFLIEKNEVDIYDIPIAKITNQYMEYIEKLSSINIEQVGDFLIIASYLLNLKSKMLLPKHNIEEIDDENENIPDPRDELVEKLLEYKKFKEAAHYLASIQVEEPQIFFRNTSYNPEINEVLIADIKSLVNAYKEVINKLDKPVYNYNIPDSDINVADKMQELHNILGNKTEGLVFQDIFVTVNSKREALAFFLALLELIRLQKVSARQNEFNDNIIINLVGDYNYDDEK